MTKLELLVVVARKIWFRRNTVHGGDFSHPNRVFRESVESLDEFRRLNSKVDATGEGEKEEVQIKWKSPIGMIKVNWDVAVDKKKGCIGFGTIVKDSTGSILGARSITKNILVELVVAKALAPLHAVEFSQELGLHQFILEGDVVQIV